MKVQTIATAFLFLVLSPFVLAQDQDSKNQKPASPIFRDGAAQVVPEFSDEKAWIKEELWVETDFDSDNDGKKDRMHVFVTRPYQTDSQKLQLPVIYNSSPYFGLRIWTLLTNSRKKYLWNVDHEIGEIGKPHKSRNINTRKKRPFYSTSMDRTWVPRGYIMVYSSSPGTGLSDGAPTIGGENESLAPKAVIDWLCGREKGFSTRKGNEEIHAYWSTGKVGMTGTSYNGTLCIAAATTGVEGLKAIIPVAPVTSFYPYYRSNGLVRSPGGYLGEDMDVLYDMINSGEKSKRKQNNAKVRDEILKKNQDRITGDYNEFWPSRDYLNKIDSMKAAMIMAHGFNDWNVMPEHSFRFYQAAKEKGLPVRLYYHQEGHGGEPPFHMMNSWFTKYLHGIENNVENQPEVLIERVLNKYLAYYPSYPDMEASDLVLHIQNDKNEVGKLQFEMPTPQELDTLIDDSSIKGEDLIDSINAKHRLLFVTPILKEDIRISGVPQVSIRLGSDKPAANLSVWLVSLPWNDEKRADINDNIINRGWADPQNHKSLTKGEALKEGEFYQVSFELMPDDQIIPKGQQIGLMIFSSDNEFTIRPEPGTKLIIDPNSTTLTLPIVGGIEKYKEATKNSK
ncbi:Xaa-Pro dipeptidyl-peptidase [Brumimicrobium mesophilum]|uniref:Xaa-Pro dipeptidyl-peptidase n=1 Tax=Brumimicrobium mesophilum TaxID=392717 RepID=UPI000D142E57|nr:Xaa-Pro dipeptidyl-peptidase [Brumimicrobium mesophilum]